MKTAVITGVTGQDGSYLAEFLLDKGYRVIGVIRSASTSPLERIKGLNLDLRTADLLDQTSIDNIIEDVKPNEVYNLAAQSFVPNSWTQPIYTGDVNGLGPARILESIRRISPHTRFYQASTSEMFGKVKKFPQNEQTPFYPRSPYGASKAFAHYLTVNYRESYGLHASSGILFNHESPRRGLGFVTRKITNSVAKIKLGVEKYLELGNLEAQRDWGFAGDYVEAMWLMMQQEVPDDYVIATCRCLNVEFFCRKAFECVDLDYKDYVRVNKKFIRPADVDLLQGDFSKAYMTLGWEPKTTLEQLIDMMVKNDLAEIKNDLN